MFIHVTDDRALLMIVIDIQSMTVLEYFYSLVVTMEYEEGGVVTKNSAVVLGSTLHLLWPYLSSFSHISASSFLSFSACFANLC